MPIYEYQCESCQHRLEALQKMADALLIDCPRCDQPALKKLISAAAFKLTGSGWYETDFKNAGPKGGAASGDASSPTSASAGPKGGATSGDTPSPTSASAGD